MVKRGSFIILVGHVKGTGHHENRPSNLQICQAAAAAAAAAARRWDRPISDTEKHIREGANYPDSLTVPQSSTGKNVSFVLRIPQLEDKMAIRILTGDGSRTAKLFFDGNDFKYELW